MKKVIFTKEAIVISDFDAIKKYESIKNEQITKISSKLILDMFRRDLSKNIFTEIEFIVIEKDKVFSDTSKDGSLCTCWNSDVLNISLNTLIHIEN